MPLMGTIGGGSVKAGGFTLKTVKTVIAAAVDNFINYVQALYHFDPAATGRTVNNAFVDGSTNAIALTANGNVTQGSFSPYNQADSVGSCYFDGSASSYLSIPSLLLGTNNFTIECWFYPTSSAPMDIISNIVASSNATWNLSFTNGIFNFGTGTTSCITSTNNVGIDSWIHVAIVRTSASVISMYVNGIFAGSYTTALTFSTANPIIVGAQGSTYISPVTGYVAGVRIVNGTAVYNGSFVPPVTPPAAIGGTALLLNFPPSNGQSVVDQSATNAAITKAGDPSIQGFIPSQWMLSSNGGGAMYFDGSTGYISAAANAAFAFGTNNFSVEAWIFPTFASYPTDAFIVGTDNSATTAPATQWALMLYNGEVAWLQGDGGIVQSNTVVPLNQWSHIAVQRTGGSMYLYVNGVLATGTNSVANTNNYSSTGPLAIGSLASTPGDYYAGYVSDLRVVNNGVAYTPSFTVPTAEFPEAACVVTGVDPFITDVSTLMHFDGTNGSTTFTDQVAGNTWSANGTVSLSTAHSQFGGSALFPNNAGYISTPANTGFNLGSGDFTIEAWVYQLANNTGYLNVGYYQTIIGQLDLGTGTNEAFGVVTYNGMPNGGIVNGTTGYGTVQAASALTLNTWNHIAYVRHGSTFTLYVNGVAAATATSALAANTSTYQICIGADSTGKAIFNGYIDEVRVTKGIARYLNNFTVPTAEFQNSATGTEVVTYDPYFTDNAVLMHFDGTNGSTAFTDIMGNAWTATGSPSISTAQSKFGGSSLYVNGGYISTPAQAAFTFNSNNFTIESWVYPTASGTFDIVGNNHSNDGNITWVLGTTTGNVVRFTGWTNTWLTGTKALSLNTWTHVAVVRSGNIISLYINGVLDVTAAFTQVLSGSQILQIGYDLNGYWSGYIDELRITNGAARYLNSFTPPPAPLTAIANTALLVNGTNAAAIDSVNKTEIELFGTAAITTTTHDLGSGSLSLSGNSGAGPGTSYAAFTDNRFTDFGNANFTIECWVNYSAVCSTTSSCGVLLGRWGIGPSTNTDFLFCIAANTEYLTFQANYTGVSIADTVALPANVWNHVAITRDGNVWTLWKNGVAVAAQTVAAAIQFSAAQAVRIGIFNGGWLNGYIADLRVTKGVSRYNATFTPPTAELPNTSGTATATDGTEVIFALGNTATATSKYIIATGTVTSGGALAAAVGGGGAFSNSSLGIVVSGNTGTTSSQYNFSNDTATAGSALTINAVGVCAASNITEAIVSPGNATSTSNVYSYSLNTFVAGTAFTAETYAGMAAGNNVEAIFAHGYIGSAATSSTNKITYAGDSVVAGTALSVNGYYGGAAGNAVEAIFQAGYNSSATPYTSKYTFAGDAVVAGTSMSVAGYSGAQAAGNSGVGIFSVGEGSAVTNEYAYATGAVAVGTSLSGTVNGGAAMSNGNAGVTM